MRRAIEWPGKLGAFGLLAIVYLFLYAPILVMALFSFNDSKALTLPLSGFTWRWYSDLIRDTRMMDAIVFSLQVSLSAVAVSALAAVLFALILHRMAFRGKGAVQALIVAPVALPGIVLGISLLVVFRAMRIQPGYLTIVAGHATFITPIIMFIVLQRLKSLGPNLENASMDLGAGYLRTIWHVTLPAIRIPVVAGCLLGFTMSFDEITLTLFLTGVKATLPVFVWTLLRFGFTPEVNAVFTLVGGVSVVLILAAATLLSRGGVFRGMRSGRRGN